MPRRKKLKAQVVWSEEEDNLLLVAVREDLRLRNQGQDEDGAYAGPDSIDWHQIASAVPGKPYDKCEPRLKDIHQAGNYFATIDELCPNTTTRWAPIDPSNWITCQSRVCRESAPDFTRKHLQRDTRDPREFVNTVTGACLSTTIVGESITTVNDALVPVDIFGKPINAAEKAHLLPKERDDATTWNYPACAVLGLSMSLVDTDVVEKAVLGCSGSSAQQRQQVKYPGIRNLLCNIVRMSNQGPLFDKDPFVFIFPICSPEWAKAWTGQAYDAIVLCQSATDAQRIGMTSVTLGETESATRPEINYALGLASEICQFLAHSVLQKTESQVNKYQNDADKAAHARFRSEKNLLVPQPLSVLPVKPVFKIFFDGHDIETPGVGHSAPDPLLLAFKSCNNWCRKRAGFRMLAGAEPAEDLDDLSEEGRQNLTNYLSWQDSQRRHRQHDEIMEMFGGDQGGISVP